MNWSAVLAGSPPPDMNWSFSTCSIRPKSLLIFKAQCCFKTSKAGKKFISIRRPCALNINAGFKTTARVWKPSAANWVSRFIVSPPTNLWTWRCMIFSAAAAGAANGFAGTSSQSCRHELSDTMVFARRGGGCRTDFISFDPAIGARADAVQFADVSAPDNPAHHAPPQTGTFLVAADALRVPAAAGHRFCAAVFFQQQHAAAGGGRRTPTRFTVGHQCQHEARRLVGKSFGAGDTIS